VKKLGRILIRPRTRELSDIVIILCGIFQLGVFVDTFFTETSHRLDKVLLELPRLDVAYEDGELFVEPRMSSGEPTSAICMIRGASNRQELELVLAVGVPSECQVDMVYTR
jgi:hypothetical protein